MSFYIRKSISFGPVRVNLSKSGVGLSFGVRGARVSTGPRGTYIHLGSHGVYYRQKIDGSISDTPSSHHRTSTTAETIETADVSDLVESSNKELLSQMNSRLQQPTYAWLVGVLSTVVACAIASLTLVVQSNASVLLASVYPFLLILPSVVAVIVWTFGIWIARVTNQQEKLARTTTLQYKLDDGAKKEFTAVQNALADLAKSACLWRVVSQTPNWDWKRNAGASSLITRTRIKVVCMLPPSIRTRIKVYGILLDSMQLFFLPDQVFVFQSEKYGAVSYNTLQVDASPTKFIEVEGVPSDSEIVDHTWRYVRKDGSPDMRFSNNRQIPVAQYG